MVGEDSSSKGAAGRGLRAAAAAVVVLSLLAVEGGPKVEVAAEKMMVVAEGGLGEAAVVKRSMLVVGTMRK